MSRSESGHSNESNDSEQARKVLIFQKKQMSNYETKTLVKSDQASSKQNTDDIKMLKRILMKTSTERNKAELEILSEILKKNKFIQEKGLK